MVCLGPQGPAVFCIHSIVVKTWAGSAALPFNSCVTMATPVGLSSLVYKMVMITLSLWPIMLTRITYFCRYSLQTYTDTKPKEEGSWAVSAQDVWRDSFSLTLCPD